MERASVTVRTRGTRPGEYRIEIGAGNLSELGELARRSLTPAARRLGLISNPRVFSLYGRPAVESLGRADFQVAHWLMGEGERYKTLRSLEKALDFLSAAGLERGDAVVALGGGVVGDLSGFAAAVYLRGIDFIQVPTTLLAQIDSSVGGKTGVNTARGKNLVGAFHQPRAVLIDLATHTTLPPRELTAGWCEAVKQGAVASRRLFDQTRGVLAARAADPARDLGAEIVALIAAQCAFKASIVAGDEREQLSRTDARSRKVLNFGHTVGHALEAVTRYRRFRHGEAVGRGMLAAGELSFRLGILPASELELLRDAVRTAGPLPRASDLNLNEILAAISHDKKSVSGRVKWILLERLGRARIVDGQDIPPRVLRSALRSILRPDS